MAAGLAGSSALAQSSDGCSQFKWPVERERQAFTSSSLPVIKSGAAYPAMMSGVTVALDPQTAVVYPQPPARPPKSSPAFGAVIPAPSVAAPGTYQVTLSEEAWIDLVQNGVRLRASDFSGKKGCDSVRKSVRFKLGPGPVTIEISDAATERVNLDLLPVE